MVTSFEIFLKVAEELSVSRAAARCFVTQQCVSDHIKRLEEDYGILLFNRKPHFSLTEAGKILYESVLEIQKIEEDIKTKFARLKNNKKLIVGMNATRISLILPELLPIYNEIFPDVEISFVMHETRVLEQMMLKGDIDVFVGVNVNSSSKYNVDLLGMEKINIIISSKLFKKNFNLKDLTRMKKGVNFSEFKNISFVKEPGWSRINDLIDFYSKREDVYLQPLYYTRDYDTQIALCSSGLVAVVCPSMITKKILEHNEKNSKENEMFIFPLNNQTELLKIELITLKKSDESDYKIKFIELLKKHMKESIH